MAKETIYIRIENEIKWSSIPKQKRSAWVNDLLAKSEIEPYSGTVVDGEGTVFRVKYVDGELKIVGQE